MQDILEFFLSLESVAFKLSFGYLFFRYKCGAPSRFFVRQLSGLCLFLTFFFLDIVDLFLLSFNNPSQLVWNLFFHGLVLATSKTISNKRNFLCWFGLDLNLIRLGFGWLIQEFLVWCLEVISFFNRGRWGLITRHRLITSHLIFIKHTTDGFRSCFFSLFFLRRGCWQRLVANYICFFKHTGVSFLTVCLLRSSFNCFNWFEFLNKIWMVLHKIWDVIIRWLCGHHLKVARFRRFWFPFCSFMWRYRWGFRLFWVPNLFSFFITDHLMGGLWPLFRLLFGGLFTSRLPHRLLSLFWFCFARWLLNFLFWPWSLFFYNNICDLLIQKVVLLLIFFCHVPWIRSWFCSLRSCYSLFLRRVPGFYFI